MLSIVWLKQPCAFQPSSTRANNYSQLHIIKSIYARDVKLLSRDVCHYNKKVFRKNFNLEVSCVFLLLLWKCLQYLQYSVADLKCNQTFRFISPGNWIHGLGIALTMPLQSRYRKENLTLSVLWYITDWPFVIWFMFNSTFSTEHHAFTPKTELP